MHIYPNEMLHLNTATMHIEQERRCTLIMEQLPEGDPLDVVINSMSREALTQGLEMLDATLRRCNISHNNLTSRNIIVDRQGRWLPIRQYYTRRGYGGDAEGFRRLRELIIKYTTPMEEVDISRLTPWPKRSAVDMDALFEGRRQITTGEGIGFEDEFGEVVIEPQYIWASNFMENRAMVRTKEGRMGVINRYGRVIISTIYDSVEYSPSSGKSVVRCNNLYSIFDYNGKQLTQWHEMNLDRMEHK
jgi:hypothetical protein